MGSMSFLLVNAFPVQRMLINLHTHRLDEAGDHVVKSREKRAINLESDGVIRAKHFIPSRKSLGK